MGVTCYIDIETMPDTREGARQSFIDKSFDAFKAPSGATKAQLGADLCMNAKTLKFTGSADLQALWCDRFRDEKAEAQGIEAWRKSALSPDTGQLFSICYAVGDGPVVGRWREPGECEAAMLDSVLASIAEALGATTGGQRKPFFIGHNIQFDLGFLWKRAVILGVTPPFRLPWDGRNDQSFYCTMQAWAGFKGRISQDNLCAILGIQQKPSDICGSMVWDFIEAGEYQKVLDYNMYDVETVRAIHKRLTFGA